MIDVDTGRFTVGVFLDTSWAERGVSALRQAGIAQDSLSILSKETDEAAKLIEGVFGSAGERLEIPAVGNAIAKGPLVEALQGSARDLTKSGIAGTMRRVGFQAHDGRIFETLTARGGVLVAIRSEPRAADALAILHSYGGGNAAIGAWTGRV
jgi:hypothetical protein